MSLTETSFYVTGGTLRLDAPSYVERQADRDLFDNLLDGEFCYVLTSRQMGKSSLMVRTANRLRSEGIHVIALDLSAIGQNLTPAQWYNGLLTSMGDQLGLEDELEEFWVANERLSPVQRWFASIRKAVLAQRAGAVVVFLDEIDSVRSLPFSTDEFFAAIRECYNRRSEDPEFRRLTFCLLGVATPSDLIRDTRITPFNIGRRIELNDFSSDEAEVLARGLRTDGAPRVSVLLKRVLYWTGGHPYLTQRLCQSLAHDLKVNRPGDVDRLCEELFFSNRARERDDNLIFVRERMLRSEADLTSLLGLYLKVRDDEPVADDETSPLVSIMRLSGIVRSEQGRLTERNRIYYRVFDRDWVRANLPDADLRRQRAAFRRGVVRTAGIAAIVVVAMTIMVLIAMKEAVKAGRASAQSYYTQAQARRVSGLSGQRYESLNALEQARGYYTNEAALRDEAIACLALVDLKEPRGIYSPRQTNLCELNLDLDLSATAEVDGSISIRQLKDRGLLKTLPGSGVAVEQLRFGPRDSCLVARYHDGAGDQTIVWDWQKGQKLFVLPNGLHAQAIDFSPDGRKLAVARTNGQVTVYSLPGGERLREFELMLTSGFPRVPQVLRFNPSGDLLAESCLDDLNVQIWSLDANQAAPVASLYHPDKVYDLSWHPRGELLATACGDSSVYIWNTKRTNDHAKKLIGHESAVTGVSFNHRGTMIATLGRDETLRLWTPATERQMARRVDGENFERLQFNASDRLLMAIDNRQTNSRVWDVSGEEYLVLEARTGPVDRVKGIDFSPDSRLLAAVSGEEATIWESDSGRELGVVLFTNAHAAGFSADSRHLVASTDSGLFKCSLSRLQGQIGLEAESEYCQLLAQAPDELGMMAMFPDRSAVAVVHQEEVLVVPLESDGRNALQTFRVDRFYQLLALHPRAEWLATATRDSGSVHLWDLSRADTATASVTIPSSEYFAFSPDSQWLVACSAWSFQFYRVGSWDKPRFSIPRKSSSNQQAPIAITRDGTTAALASSRYTIQLVKLPRGDGTRAETIATLEGPDRIPLEILAFSPDGRHLAAGTINQMVQVWNLALLRDGLAALKLERSWPLSP